MLYFAYGALLDPERLEPVAPTAEFRFIAHLPETKLTFPNPDGVPSVEPAPGNTVWGAVFEVAGEEGKAIARAEAKEGRLPRTDFRAVDRAGRKYEVVTFTSRTETAPSPNDTGHVPDPVYMRQVVKGARHWNLPTGWVAGLEDLGEDALI
jgi:gamma-glutamylcyclotransferase